MVRRYACHVLSIQLPEDATQMSDIIQEKMAVDGAEGEQDEVAQAPGPFIESFSALKLSKLCFMIGHVAMKEIVHLESIESEWKRRKHLGTFFIL